MISGTIHERKHLQLSTRTRLQPNKGAKTSGGSRKILSSNLDI